MRGAHVGGDDFVLVDQSMRIADLGLHVRFGSRGDSCML